MFRRFIGFCTDSALDIHEPRPDQNNKVTVRTAKTDQSLRCALSGWLRTQAFFMPSDAEKVTLVTEFSICTLTLQPLKIL